MHNSEFHRVAVLFLVFLSCACIREWAKAFIADKLGDPTPRSEGRLTLNPIVHLDLFASVIVPLIIYFSIGWFFGGGKPINYNKNAFKNPDKDELKVCYTGLLSTLVLCLFVIVVGGMVIKVTGSADLYQLIREMIIPICVLLTVFHSLPIPPSDGAILFKHYTKMSEETYHNLSRWGIFIILFLIFVFGRVIFGAIALVSQPFILLLNLIT